MGVFRRDKSATQATPSRGIRASVPITNNLPSNSVFLKPVPNAASSVAYNTPRALTAAATQLKIGDRSEAEQFKNGALVKALERNTVALEKIEQHFSQPKRNSKK